MNVAQTKMTKLDTHNSPQGSNPNFFTKTGGPHRKKPGFSGVKTFHMQNLINHREIRAEPRVRSPLNFYLRFIFAIFTF